MIYFALFAATAAITIIYNLAVGTAIGMDMVFDASNVGKMIGAVAGASIAIYLNKLYFTRRMELFYN